MVIGDYGAPTLLALKRATADLKQGQESVTILHQWMVVEIVPESLKKPLLATQMPARVSNTVIGHTRRQY